MKQREISVKLPAKILGWLLCILILWGCTLAIISISKHIYQENSNAAEHIDLDELSAVNYLLYYDAMRAEDPSIDVPIDAYFDKSLVSINMIDDDYGGFNSQIWHYASMLGNSDEVQSLVYKNQEIVVDRSNDDRLLDDYYNALIIADSKELEQLEKQLQQKYIYYAVIQYDTNGVPMVMDSYGREKREIETAVKQQMYISGIRRPVFEEVVNDTTKVLKNADKGLEGKVFLLNGQESQITGYTLDEDGFYYEYMNLQDGNYERELMYRIIGEEAPGAIKDVTMVITMSHPNAVFSGYTPFLHDYQIIPEGFVYLLISIIAVVLVLSILAASIRPMGIATGFTSYFPLEVNFGLGILIVIVTPIMEWLTRNHTNGWLEYYMNKASLPSQVASVLENALVYGGWFLYFAIIFLVVVSSLSIFRKGIRRYCLENVMIIRCVAWFVRLCRRGIEKIVMLRYEEPVNKYVLKVVVLNFFVIAIMCSIWFFGIPVLIVYSILLFYFLQKYLNGLKEKYDHLLQVTNNMAKGNLDITVDENMGLFTPIARELNQLKGAFKLAVEEEVKSQKMKTELITNVSHDLKTPLTAIITYINLLKEENITKDQQKEYIETLDNKAFRLKQLIEDLFEVSKFNSNNITLDPVEVDIVELIKQVQVELSDRFEEAGIEFRFTSFEEKVILHLDSQKTYRIFENLFMNVIKYAQPGTRAYLSIEKNSQKIVIVLKNISAQELHISGDELTERFVRGDESRNTEGSGLGLAIVKSIIEVQGGKFYVEIDGDLFKAVIEFIL